ncbi:cyclohexanecarboxylate-CoA ligase [Williamsia limnetica]|uniref:Cyclohexanecarboxylate-CoA ligase n=1 Tax=Williamsia limnetica TaxID=882452 RepID=A0A318RE96_WILLI|nr:AMP-binding protein [Williamsia limnetica]PYE12335.1 cyclohexanecarboxylate-CoA ligase [Williamsia limnetica]
MTNARNLGRYTTSEVDHYYTTGQWTEENFTDLIRGRATAVPDKVFVTDGVSSVTYHELFAQSQRLALGLRQKGLRSGDRVAVQLPNWAEFVIAAAALARIGAVTVPIMPIYRADEVGHVVRDAQIKMAITATRFKGFDYASMYEGIRADNPVLEFIVVVRSEGDERESIAGRSIDIFEKLLVSADLDDIDDLLDVRTHPDDPFVVVYTSGTTSRPKGCLHTFNTYAAGARGLMLAFDHNESDVQFGPSPITHTTGLVTSVLIPLLSGAASHIMADWEPSRALADIEQYGCTMSVTATTFLQMLMAASDANPAADLSSLRAWVCAGSPIPAAVVENANAKLPSASILSLYGRSENLTTTTCTTTDEPRRAITSDGSALPGTAVKVVDPDGVELPRGSEGDIAYHGPSHMIEYLNRPAETAELYTHEGYSRSGDLGVMDEDGFVRVTGRTKDIIIRGGMNISVREVEDKLAAHPDLSALAVVGMPDERLGERVCCFVVARDGHSAPDVDQLRVYLTERGVAVQKTPERVEVVDQLPMTATGKIQKHVLRKTAAASVAGSRRHVASA